MGWVGGLVRVNGVGGWVGKGEWGGLVRVNGVDGWVGWEG